MSTKKNVQKKKVNIPVKKTNFIAPKNFEIPSRPIKLVTPKKVEIPVKSNKEIRAEFIHEISVIAESHQMTLADACVFLKKKGFKLNDSDIEVAYEYFKEQKQLDEYSLDELNEWRLAVRQRLYENENEIRRNDLHIKEVYRNYNDENDKLYNKRKSDLDWYNKVSSIIALKTKMRSKDIINFEIPFSE